MNKKTNYAPVAVVLLAIIIVLGIDSYLEKTRHERFGRLLKCLLYL